MFCSCEVEARLLRLQLVGNKSAEQINAKVHRTPVSGVFDLFLVLELVIDGLNDATSSKHNLVHEWEEFVLHILLDAGDEPYILAPQRRKQIFRDVTPISEKLTDHSFGEFCDGLNVVVWGIARSDEKGDKLSFFIHNEVQFEAVEPTHRAFATCRQSFEHFVAAYPPVVTDHQLGGVDVVCGGR